MVTGMGRSLFVPLLVSAALAALVRPAAARPASSGWFAEGGLGAVTYLPPRASKAAALGPALNLRVGRDLFSWLSIGIDLAASSHEATVPAPPEGEWFQLYRGGADIRIGGRLDRVALFLEGDLGGVLISSNVLGKVGITDPAEKFSVLFQAGAGLEYQLENRHYAVGFAADGFMAPQFVKLYGVDTRAYLRYTY